jgi:transcriptional regulator NrdR family protein
MICQCGGKTYVLDSRLHTEGYWRRRRCAVCKAEFTTIEKLCTSILMPRGKDKKTIQAKKSVVSKRINSMLLTVAPSLQPKAPVQLVEAAEPSEPVESARDRIQRLRDERELASL